MPTYYVKEMNETCNMPAVLRIVKWMKTGEEFTVKCVSDKEYEVR